MTLPIPASLKGTEPRLSPISVEGKWGYIDSTGKVVIEPKFLKANYFSEGLAVVKVAGTTKDDLAYERSYDGFIGPDGKFVIPPEPPQAVREMQRYKFYSYHDFHDGLARIHINDASGVDGYIDRQGQLAIYPNYKIHRDFSEGLAFVTTWSPWDEPGPQQKGFINKRGELVIKNDAFQFSSNFSDGRATVTLRSRHEDEKKYGLIDAQGKFVIWPGVYDYISDPVQGMISVVKNRESALLDGDGKIIVPFGVYDYFRARSASLFLAVKNDERFLIDSQGKLQARVIPAGDIGDFHEGLATIEVDGHYGFIDESGTLRIAAQFDYAGPFKHGLTLAKIDNTCGYINRAGEFVWQTDRWEKPLQYAVSEPISTYLPNTTIEALPLSYNWDRVKNAIVFVADGDLESLRAWYRKICTGDIKISDFTDFESEPGKIDLLISPPGEMSLEMFAYDGNQADADDFVNFYRCQNMTSLRKTYPTKIVGILIDS